MRVGMSIDSLFTSKDVDHLFHRANELQNEIAHASSAEEKSTKSQELDRLLRKLVHIAKLDINHSYNNERLSNAKKLCERAIQFLQSDALEGIDFKPLDKFQHKFQKAIKKVDQAQKRIEKKSFVDTSSNYAMSLQHLVRKNPLPLLREFVAVHFTDIKNYFSGSQNINELVNFLYHLNGKYDPLFALIEKQSSFQYLRDLPQDEQQHREVLKRAIEELKPLRDLPSAHLLLITLESVVSREMPNWSVESEEFEYCLKEIEKDIALHEDILALKKEHPAEVRELTNTLQGMYDNAKNHFRRMINFLQSTCSSWENFDANLALQNPEKITLEQREALIIINMVASKVLDRFDILFSLRHFADANNEQTIKSFRQVLGPLPCPPYELDLRIAQLPDPQLTYDIRMKCLKLIQSSYGPDDRQKVLILGAGPGGLTRSSLAQCAENSCASLGEKKAS